MKNLFYPFLLAVLSTFSLTSCDKEDSTPDPDPDPDPKVEQIASYLKMAFEPVGDTITPPALYPYVRCELNDSFWNKSTSGLRKNRIYEVSIVFEDRRTNPVKDINALILSKADEYQFFILSNNEYEKFEPLDIDSKGLPIGLRWKATVKGNTTLFSNDYDFIMIHAPGTKNGTPSVGKKVFELSVEQTIL